jgi:hypothetical protein
MMFSTPATKTTPKLWINIKDVESISQSLSDVVIVFRDKSKIILTDTSMEVILEALAKGS